MEVLTNIEVLRKTHGCRTIRALYRTCTPVICKILSFQNKVTTEKGLEYYQIAQNHLQNCPHILRIIDVIVSEETSLCVVFEEGERSLAEEMKVRRENGQGWTGAEVSDMVLPLVQELAYLEEKKLLVSAPHPEKIFLLRGHYVLSRVSYPLYDIQKARTWLQTPVISRFCAPEFSAILSAKGNALVSTLTLNNVFCLGLTAYCLLTTIPPDRLDVNIPVMQETLVRLQIPPGLRKLLHRMLAFDEHMRTNFQFINSRIPEELSQVEVILRIGVNEFALKGINSLQQIREITQNALQTDQFSLLDSTGTPASELSLQRDPCIIDIIQLPQYRSVPF